MYTVQPGKNPSARNQTLHRAVLLPCRFLSESKEPELARATTATRPQTRSLKQPVVKPVAILESFSEDKDWRPHPAPISSPITFHVEDALPANSSSCQDAVPECTFLPEHNLPAVREPSQTGDVLDPSSSQEEEEAVLEEPEEEQEMDLGEALPEPDPCIVPEEGPEPKDPVETSSDPAVALALDSPEAVPSVIDSEGRDAMETVVISQSVVH